MRPTYLFVFALAVLSAASVCAQFPNPLIAGSRGLQAVIKDDIMRSVDKIPEDLWSFRPTPQVRTIAQLFAHVADGQYEFCSATEGAPVIKKIEETAKTKAEITAALKEAFAYCDGAYAKLTPESAVEVVPFFGRKMTRIGIMDFNIAHSYEHYGNLVTYMRIKGIVPPSSESQK